MLNHKHGVETQFIYSLKSRLYDSIDVKSYSTQMTSDSKTLECFSSLQEEKTSKVG